MTDATGSGSRFAPIRVAAACMAVLVGVAVVRLALGGWEALSADHARYIYAGLSLIDGRGYVNEIGDPFLFRAPAFPLLTGSAWLIAGSFGAHLVVWIVGVASLLLAVVLATRLGGSLAAILTTAAIVGTPLFWEQVVGLGIDQPQTALYLAAILLLWEATVGRWLAAGALVGLGLLVKETLAPAVVLLPIAWLPVWTPLGWSRWLRLSAAFVLAAVLVAGWWWIAVWGATGEIFPLNALRAIVPDDVEPQPVLAGASLVVLVVGGLAWAVLIATRATDPRVRVLLVAALATLPAAATSVVLGQASRNLTALILLTCVSIGVTGAELWLRLQASRGGDAAERRSWPLAGAAAVIVVLASLAAAGQATVEAAIDDPLPTATAEVLRPRLAPGDDVVSTFRDRSTLGLELFDTGASIVLLSAQAVQATSDPSDYLWLGVRRGTLLGTSRERWIEVVGDPRAAFLVITLPHPLSPAELVPALRGGPGAAAGLTEVKRVETEDGRSFVFANDPARAGAMAGTPLHAAPDALLLWLDQAEAAGLGDPVPRLLAAAPIVPQLEGLRQLAERIGDRGCLRREQEGARPAVVIEANAGQDGCLDPAELP